jgi:hypothetical protein
MGCGLNYGQLWWTPHHLSKEQMEELGLGVEQGLYDNLQICSFIICLLGLWLVCVYDFKSPILKCNIEKIYIFKNAVKYLVKL